LNSSLDVIITEKWYAEQLCCYVGDRKDLKPIQYFYIYGIVTLKVISMLAHVGYKYNSQLTGCRANNCEDQGYQNG
jgi:hypothetical protein